MTFSFGGALCLEHHGTTSSSNLLSQNRFRNFIAVFHWLNIKMKAFTSLFADFIKLFWKNLNLKANFKWRAASHFVILIQKFLDTINEIRRFLSPMKFAQTHLKLFQVARSVSVRLYTKALSSTISWIWGPTKMSSFSFAPLMVGKFLLRRWNPSEFVVSMAFTKHLVNPSFLWKEEGISSWD